MTDRIIYDCEQGSPEWFACRMGIPTSSRFATVMAKGQSSAESKTRLKYMRQLAGEIITGEPMMGFSNAHTDRGTEMEPEALAAYAFEHGHELQRVGFVRWGDKGCSPDALIGSDGMVQCKTRLPDLQIELLESGNVPTTAIPQLQGELWVADREWTDYLSYWPKLPLFVRRVYRDEAYHARLSSEVDRFNRELAALVEKIRSMT